MRWMAAALMAAAVVGAARVSFAAIVVGQDPVNGGVTLVRGNTLADVYVDAKDAAVAGIAAGELADDVERVTGRKLRVVHEASQLGANAVIVGTIGQSALVDQLIAAKKIDVSDVKGQWETFKVAVVDHPVANVDSAVVIVGSDRRGTAYGVFDVSEAIGVSPWYWWADVTPEHRDLLVISPGMEKAGPPSVKYRGIFINDEDWGLRPWASKTFDPQLGNIGPKTYAKVFELMLRLRLNYIWPAMHPGTTEFGQIEENYKLADQWGIVAGASHPEGMNRNNVDWPKMGLGEWRFDTNRQNMINFWEEWAKKRGPYEAVWTIGMRGVHDAPMLGPPDMAGKVKLLESAIDAQRDLLKKYVNPDIEKVPQVFCPYKEALQQYRAGLKLPDDVIICWTEDNYGWIRQLSDPKEQARKGGSGVYYHISYLGSPFSYVWINTTPPALIWEEMSKAYAYGADKLWVLNVGDIKPGEVGIDFWAKMGWDIHAYDREKLPQFLVDWASGIFGKEHAPEIAKIMDTYYRLGFARKPESLYKDPSCFSVADYGEASGRLAAYEDLMQQADALAATIPAEKKDAYFELVLYPVRMAALTNEVFVGDTFNKQYAAEKNPLANSYAGMIEGALAQIDKDTAYYNDTLAGGKWKDIMTAKGTTSPQWGFKWPTPEKVGDGKDAPALPAPEREATVAQTSNSPAFAEKDGYVSIEAEHPTRTVAKNGVQWQVIPGLGRTGDTMAVFPVTAPSVDPEKVASDAAAMEYDFTTDKSGDAAVTVYCLPTRRINDVRGLRYAIAIDHETPQVVDFNQEQEGRAWQQNVMRDAAITVTKHGAVAAGKHTLHVWAVDPGVVMDKIVIDLGGAKPSYLGPPETAAGR